MSELTTITAYAGLHGVTPQTIRNQISLGVIRLIAKGIIDREQADRSWASSRRVRISDDNDLGQRSAQAKIAGGIAKLRLIRHRFERLQGRYLDRKPSVQGLLNDIEVMLIGLRALPAAEVARVTQQLGIDVAVARDLLAEFLDLALGELGDVAAEARAAVQSAGTEKT